MPIIELRVDRMTYLRWLAVAALAVGLASCSRSPKPPVGEEASRKPAPDFTLKDVNGQTVKLSDYRGKVVLVNFWATWCGPCKIEIPWFMGFEQQYKARDFAVLGISMDDDGWTAVKPYLQEHKINYRVVVGDDDVSKSFGEIDSLPTTFVIDRSGRIASQHTGLVSKSVYEQEIAMLLDAPRPGASSLHTRLRNFFDAVSTHLASLRLGGQEEATLRPEQDRHKAPDFSLEDAKGQTVKLSDFRGKVVVLNFWATWCAPCQEEIPWFISFAQQYKDRDFAVLGVSLDDDGWKVVKPYIAQKKMNYPVLLGGDTVSLLYGGIESLPTTFIIDREGRIAGTHVGLVSKNTYGKEILSLLETPKNDSNRGAVRPAPGGLLAFLRAR